MNMATYRNDTTITMARRIIRKSKHFYNLYNYKEKHIFETLQFLYLFMYLYKHYLNSLKMIIIKNDLFKNGVSNSSKSHSLDHLERPPENIEKS